MFCSVCGTESPETVRYCPTCGTPLQTAAQPTAQPADYGQAPVEPVRPQNPAYQQYSEADYQISPQDARQVGVHYSPVQPTVQQPTVQQPTVQQPYVAPQQVVQPMQSAMPGGVMGRSVDMSGVNKKPVWPFVLVIVLLLLIIVAALLLWHPWSSGAQSGTATVGSEGTVVVTSVEGQAPSTSDTASDEGIAVVDNTAQVVSQSPQVSTDEQVYAQLTAAYDQFAGFDARIGSVVDFFNSFYPSSADAASLQSQLDAAQALQAELASQLATLDAIVLPEGSAYVQALANMKTLNNDLTVRIGDLADALSAWLSGDMDAAADALTRHNENGTSIYKSEYESLYPNARP